MTYVLSHDDPGGANWISTGGLGCGLMIIRWQQTPTQFAVDDLVRSHRVVGRDDLDSVLPVTLRRVTPNERAAELAARAEAFERRFRV
jgi:hypothetical protein